MTETVCTNGEFARRIGVKPGYVTQLRKAGRLVLADDGKRILAEASEALIEATRDPSSSHVAERWRAARADKAAGSAPAQTETVAADRVPVDYQSARALREHYQALRAEMDYRREAGRLVDAAEVAAVIEDMLTTLRQVLESLPVTVGSMLAAEQDEARCVALLRDEISRMLRELARRAQQLKGVG